MDLFCGTVFFGALFIVAIVVAASARRRANVLQSELNDVRREVATLSREIRDLHDAVGMAQTPAAAAVPHAGIPVAQPQPAPPVAPPLADTPPAHVPAAAPAFDAAAPQPAAAPPPPGQNPATPWIVRVDWENLVGIRLFSWIAGIALVLAAVFLFKYSVEHGWLRPAVRATLGLASGVALLVVCELRVARNYRFTANAMLGAGIAILYATLFALYGRWQLWPATAAFGGMIVVTAAAVYLSTRRDSIFVALLGLLGGFATPALLSTGENRPITLFSYLLLLNGGIAWIAWRKRWPVLTALSVALTVIYQWAWVEAHLTRGQLPLAAAIFAVFAAGGAIALWSRREGDDDRVLFRRIGAAGAVLPLLFAFFTALVPEYGAQYHVLFAFLLFLAGGLTATAMLRGYRLLHAIGGASVLLTFFLWLSVSYTSQSWPWSLVWLAAFIALYLVAGLRMRTRAVYTAPALFFAFIGLTLREPEHYATLTGAMLALLAIVIVFALRRSLPHVATLAIALSSIAVMATDDAPAWQATGAHAVLFAALMLVAWTSGRHALAVAAVPFMAFAVLTADRYDAAAQLTIAGILYALFIAYPLFLGARVRQSLAPHVAAALASVVFFATAYALRTDLGYESFIGAIPLGQAAVMLVLLWRLLPIERVPSRLAIVAGTALAFVTAAIPVQLEREWITIAWALEAAALAWIFTRIPHRGLIAWSGGLAAAVLIRLVFNPAVFEYHPRSETPLFNWYLYTYAICAAAMFALARLAPRGEDSLRKLAAAAGTIELFFLLNIQIADFYSTGETLTFNFISSSLAQELTYTIGWALFALALLVTGIAMQSRGARGAALALLLVTILKCFLHDLSRLGGLYRVASLFGLAVSLVLVGLMLQKFVILRRTERGVSDPTTPTGDASA